MGAGPVNQRKRKIHSLWKHRHARCDDRVGRVLQIARIFDVASQTEENALSRNDFLIRKTTCVIASYIGSIANVSLSIEPQCWKSGGDKIHVPLINTLLWWNPINGPTKEELHSPDETPVFGARSVSGLERVRTDNAIDDFCITARCSMLAK